MKWFVIRFIMLVCIPYGVWVLSTRATAYLIQTPEPVIESSSNDCHLPPEESDDKAVKVTFTKSKLILTDFAGEEMGSGKKATLKKLAVTLTFDRNMFGDDNSSIISPNGMDWNKQTKLVREYINNTKLYEDYWIFLENNKAILMPLVGQKNCNEQIDDLLRVIQDKHGVELFETHSK